MDWAEGEENDSLAVLALELAEDRGRGEEQG
jgi:hypothetical protein